MARVFSRLYCLQGDLQVNLEDCTNFKPEPSAEWVLGEYVSRPCPNCTRHRLCVCSDNKHRCEKCNWVVEDSCYYDYRRLAE